MRSVTPLGILSLLEGQATYAQRREEMRAMAGALDRSERNNIASYLRKGSVVLAIMEYTTDIVDGKFGTSGGSGILTDGEYYWRGDAADYVEVYGVSPGEAFIRHVHERGGEPPSLSQDTILEIDDYLVSLRRRKQ